MKLSLSIEETISLTSIGRTKVYEAINTGKLKAKKYDGRTIILRTDLETFLSDLDDYLIKP